MAFERFWMIGGLENDVFVGFALLCRIAGLAFERFWIIGELEGVVFVGFAGMEDWLLKDSGSAVNFKAAYS